ncbi:MAG: NTP transferase domain-containing protein [Myxococcales bacterium]|jgi:CTP:molybdopterin cytidylyltransferase MocA|nr:NTP transferase domain-containing protein [Myxococcales bacterium]
MQMTGNAGTTWEANADADADRPRIGLLLAAGASSRMGRPKALIEDPITGHTFLERLIEVMRLGGCDAVLVVAGCHVAEIAARLPRGALLVHNPDWAEGQLSSVRRGLDAALQLAPRRVALHLVDQPLIEPSDVRAVLMNPESTSTPLAIATHGGLPGHPISFSPDLARAIALDSAAASLRDALDRHAATGAARRLVEGTMGCVRGANTPEELRSLFCLDERASP